MNIPAGVSVEMDSATLMDLDAFLDAYGDEVDGELHISKYPIQLVAEDSFYSVFFDELVEGLNLLSLTRSP